MRRRFARGIKFGALFLVAVVIGLIVNVGPLPSPTGPFAVGTKTFQFTDRERPEVFSPDGKERRTIVFQMWYPTSTAAGKRAPFMPDILSAGAFWQAPIPTLLAARLHLLPTDAFENAPIAADKAPFPLVLLSHGLMGGRIQNTAMAEELASHGYVVAALDHTYDASFTVFQNNTVRCSQLYTGSGPNIPPVRSEAALYARVADVVYALTRIEHLNAESFNHQIDMHKVAIGGHSFGGATSLSAAVTDPRILAAFNMDGGIQRVRGVLDKPTLMLLTPISYELSIEDFGHFKSPKVYVVEGSGHANFTDLQLLTPLHWIIGLSGPISPQLSNRLVNYTVLTFLDEQLKGKPPEKAPTQLFQELKLMPCQLP